MLTDGISTPNSLMDGLAHKASQAAINGFALWADPHWADQNWANQHWADQDRADGTEPTTQEPIMTVSNTTRAAAVPMRASAIAGRAATATGVLLLLLILWRSLRFASRSFARPQTSERKAFP
jgi:hypothetical protein